MDTLSVVARFEAERQVLALMDHPHIATVLDAGCTDAGRPFFVMELVRGTPITRYCEAHRLPVPARLELFVAVCHAIQHAHQKGIIHRDIKPSNVLVALHEGRPFPKVIDFGIARALERSLTGFTVALAPTFVGTPAYMSPEQAEPGATDVDTRADVYSLGVLLYELLTGRTPFEPGSLLASGLEACRRTLRETEPAPPSTCLQSLDQATRLDTARLRGLEGRELVHLLRGDLDWVVMKCLEKDRARRYAGVGELAADIARHLASEPVTARPPSVAYRVGKFARRHRGMLTATACVALALVAGTVVSTALAFRAQKAEQEAVRGRAREEQLRRQAEAQHATARLNAYVADMNLTQQALAAGNLGRALQLVERHRPSPGDPDLRGFEWRLLWQSCQGNPHTAFPDQEESVQCVALSPDGTRVAAGQRDRVRVYDVHTRRLLHEAAAGGVSTAFSPDGRHFAAGGLRGVRVWTLPGWTAEQAFPDARAPLAFSPDGTRLALNVQTGVEVWRVTDWSREHAFPAARSPLAFAPDGRRLVLQGRGELELWSLETGRPEVELEGSAMSFFVGPWWFGGSPLIAFTPDGRRVLAPHPRPSWRGAFVLGVWDTESGREAAALPTDPDRAEHAGLVTGLALAADGRTLVSGSMDHSIRLWDLQAQRRTAILQGHRNEVWSVAVSADGTRVVSGGKDGSVKLWTPGAAAQADFLPGVLAPLRFSPDSRRLAALTVSNTLAILEWPSGRIAQALPLSRGRHPFRAPPALDASLQTLADTRPDGSVRVWDTAAGTTTELRPKQGRAEAVVLLPDGRTALTWGREQPVHRWDIASRTATALGTAAMQIQVSPDGASVAAIGPGSLVRIIDPVTGRERHRIETGLELAPPAAFSADGSLLAITGLSGAEHLLQVWDVGTGRQVGDCRGHKQGIRAVAFAPDGLTLASSGDDSTLRLWNVASQQEVLSFQRLGERPADLVFSPDGRRLVGAITRRSGEPGLQCFPAPSLDEIAAHESVAERNPGPPTASQGVDGP